MGGALANGAKGHASGRLFNCQSEVSTFQMDPRGSLFLVVVLCTHIDDYPVW